jgi:tetratricopeptide (TPR) repeat protein
MRYDGGSPFVNHEYEVFTRAELLDAAGRYDEALQVYRAIADQLFHSGAPAHLRLAQLYERRGEPRQAAVHYARFIDLWKDCDADFVPLVDEARRRLAAARSERSR